MASWSFSRGPRAVHVAVMATFVMLVAPAAGAVPGACGSWTIQPSPNLAGSNLLAGVAALSATDVWAVGQVAGSTGTSPLIEHNDGSAWSLVPAAVPPGHASWLTGVAGVAPDDVWA